MPWRSETARRNERLRVRRRAWSADDHEMMGIALALAEQAAAIGEVPVGAIVVRDGQIIGRGFNRREIDGDPTHHAEVAAIREAAETIGDWRLTDCTLYVTLEPCPMCAGAIVNARLGRLVYGASDPKAGAVESLYELCNDERLNHRVAITAGVRAGECGQILRRFFRVLRRRRRANRRR
jgi:tRNA(adenine34) deaminase